MNLNIHQKIVLASVFVTFLLLMYEELFHLSVELFTGLFESIEHVLDISIEYFLETDTHETQIIVFYILVPFLLYSLYWLYRFLPRCHDKFKSTLEQQKFKTIAQWQALPLIQRFEWWSFFVIYISCFLFFSF